MMLKEKTAQLRKDIKALGYTSKQVSVRGKICMYDDAIELIIKDITVNKKDVEKIADKFSSIRYDEYNGEILSGCNTYVNVQFDYDVVLEARKNFMDRAKEIFEEGKKCDEGSLITVAEDGRKTILYTPNYSYGGYPRIELSMKPEGFENMDCYCYNAVKRFDAQCVESIAEALVQFKYQYGVNC